MNLAVLVLLSLGGALLLMLIVTRTEPALAIVWLLGWGGLLDAALEWEDA